MEPLPVLELLKMCGNMCDRGMKNLGEHSIAINDPCMIVYFIIEEKMLQ
jgi:hypothetical protein